MAKDFLGSVLSIGLVGGAAYLAWQWYQAQQVQAAGSTAVTGTPTPPAPPAYVYTPPTPTQQLQTAASSNSIVTAQGGQADAYQWATIWQGIGQPAVSNVNAIFFPNGLPATQTPNAPGMSSQGLPLMSAATFLQGLQASGISTGLSGLGQATMIGVPVMLSPFYRHVMQLPAGTTPAELQARMRRRA